MFAASVMGKGRVGSLIGACDGMCVTQSTTHSTVTPFMQIGSIKVMKSVSSSTKLQIQCGGNIKFSTQLYFSWPILV